MYRVMIRVFICVMCNVLIHFSFVAKDTKDVDDLIQFESESARAMMEGEKNRRVEEAKIRQRNER